MHGIDASIVLQVLYGIVRCRFPSREPVQPARINLIRRIVLHIPEEVFLVIAHGILGLKPSIRATVFSSA